MACATSEICESEEKEVGYGQINKILKHTSFNFSARSSSFFSMKSLRFPFSWKGETSPGYGDSIRQKPRNGFIS